MLKYCAVFSLWAGVGLAQGFMTGQAARLVIGQTTFTSQSSGASNTLLGSAGGLAFANGTLFVADSNRVGLLPVNNRVLIFNNVLQNFPGPTDEIPVYSGRCPVCGGQALGVVGEPDFVTVAPLTAANGMNLPCAVATDGKILAVADTGNNRILIWKSIPTVLGQPADIVLGQKDFVTLQNVVVDNKSFRAPQGVWVQNGKLFVADTQNNRIMIWNSIPAQNDQPADVVLGVPNFTTVVESNLLLQTFTAAANTLLSPTSVTSDGTRLIVADLGNNRVLIWNSIPTQNQTPADVEIGQINFTNTIANDNTEMCPSAGVDSSGNPTYPTLCGKNLNFPRYALSDGQHLFIADSGNDRVLVYNTIPTQNAPEPDAVLGQPDEYSDIVTSNNSLFTPNLEQSGSDATPTPTSVAWDGTNLYVADPSNYRVLVYTPGQQNVPYNGVVNTASQEIFALGSVTLGGTITANDVITLTINTTTYTYTVLAADTFDTILQALSNKLNLANGGAGDPDVFAEPVLGDQLLNLVARLPGTAGNNITLTATADSTATITVTAGSANLTGGGNAATLAPGTDVTILGTNLADATAVADPTVPQLPFELGGVEVYFDGIRAPLFMVSPTQISAQLPFEVLDSNSVSSYVRIQHADGSVTATTAIGVPVDQQNPGVFAEPGQDPRPGIAYHGSSYAIGDVTVDGSVTAGDTVSVTVGDNVYTYTVQAADTLGSVANALINLINSNSEELVVASPASAPTTIILQAKIPGPEGSGILYSATSAAGPNSTAGSPSETLTPVSMALCCANTAGARITPDNPAVPGETIFVFATGLGIVGPDAATAAIADGVPYHGPALNTPNTFVQANVGGSTATVISAGLQVGSIGVYAVYLQLDTSLTTNPQAQIALYQDIYTSNIVTIPIVSPTQ